MYSRRNIIVWIVLTLTSFMNTGCVTFGGVLHWLREPPLHRLLPEKLKPRNDIFHFYPKDAPLLIQKAWLDGCHTGVAGMGGTTFRRFYRFNQDPALRKNMDYYRQWKDAYTFCRHYAYGVTRISDARSALITPQGSNTNKYGWTDLIGGEQLFFRKTLFRVDGPEGSAPLKRLQWPVATNTWSLKPSTGDHMKIATQSLADALNFKGSNYINHGSALGGLTMDWTAF